MHAEHPKQADLLIQGAAVVLPGGIEVTEVACRNGRIVAIGEPGWQAAQVLDGSGLHLLPGVVDSQVHFRQPGMEHKETIEAGTRGAVLGGVTAVFEMPNTQPLTLGPAELNAKLAIAERDAWCHYAFYLGGAASNAAQLAEYEQLPGCAGIKVFMGSSFGDLLAEEDAVLSRILAHGRRRVAIHAEDEARLRQRRALVEQRGQVSDHPLWRDVESALNATRRIVALARQQQRRLHLLHISSAEEMAFLRDHKDLVTVEVLPQHLSFAAPGCYETLGSLAQMNPPIREQRHQDALWKAINNGLVDVLGSDHAPHTRDEKARPYPDCPSGMTGVQTLLPVMLDHVNAGRLTLTRLVDLVCAGPARVFGLVGKGRIALGYDADFTLVDMAARQPVDNRWIASVSGWSPYHGQTLQGWPRATILAGKVVMQDGELIGQPAGRPLRFAETRDTTP